MEQTRFKFDSEITKKYATDFSQGCLIKIADLVKKEGYQGKSLFKEEQCIDLDHFENKLAQKEKRNAKRTMDSAFVVTENKRNPKLILCEFKFNCKKIRNLKSQELRDKIKGSQQLLGTSLQFNSFFFLFSSQQKQEARNHISRCFANQPHIMVYELEELYNHFFCF